MNDGVREKMKARAQLRSVVLYSKIEKPRGKYELLLDQREEVKCATDAN